MNRNSRELAALGSGETDDGQVPAASRHTPGPWRATRLGNGRGYIIWCGGESQTRPGYPDYVNGTLLGSVYTGERDEPGYPLPAEANASLITAAPELLEACQEAIYVLEDILNGEAPDLREALRRLREAVERAKGERP